jgi:TfoX/Sxy family transcriptional regulator of competence genes
MSMPRPDDATRAYFDSVLPEDSRVTVRPMFGNLAGFVNGNMFTGVFGSQVFVRLSAEDRAELYVTLPEAWRGEPEQARGWLLRSLAWAAALPPKETKKRKK